VGRAVAQAAPVMSMWSILPTSRQADARTTRARGDRSRSPRVFFCAVPGGRRLRWRRPRLRWQRGGSALDTLAIAVLVGLLVPTDKT